MADRTPIDRLIFVFDADSGALSAFFDSAKKTLNLGGCALCSITHGLAGEKSEWKTCREEIGVPVDYVHRDEVDDDLHTAAGGELPCVVAEAGGELVRLLDRGVLERCKGSVADLRGRLSFFATLKQLSLPEASPEPG